MNKERLLGWLITLLPEEIQTRIWKAYFYTVVLCECRWTVRASASFWKTDIAAEERCMESRLGPDYEQIIQELLEQDEFDFDEFCEANSI
jgi:hypothetical protein